MAKEQAENERREKLRKQQFAERSHRSLTRFYRQHDEDMVAGAGDVVQVMMMVKMYVCVLSCRVVLPPTGCLAAVS